MTPVNYDLYRERARQLHAEELARRFDRVVSWWGRRMTPPASRATKICEAPSRAPRGC